MMLDMLKIMAASFLGTLGFCFLLQIPRRAILPSGILGMLTYLVTWLLLQLGLSDTPSFFLGSVFGAVAAQLLSRKLHMVSTIFVLLAIVPAVPGLAIYRFMEMLGSGQYTDGGKAAVDSMVTVVAITLGIAAGSLLFTGLKNMLDRRERKMKHGDH